MTHLRTCSPQLHLTCNPNPKPNPNPNRNPNPPEDLFTGTDVPQPHSNVIGAAEKVQLVRRPPHYVRGPLVPLELPQDRATARVKDLVTTAHTTHTHMYIPS